MLLSYFDLFANLLTNITPSKQSHNLQRSRRSGVYEPLGFEGGDEEVDFKQ
jgi:hypothetical protein